MGAAHKDALHGLKSESLTDAINRHRGEAHEVIENFREGLSLAQHLQVLVFLNSLWGIRRRSSVLGRRQKQSLVGSRWSLASQPSVVGRLRKPRSRYPWNPTLPHRTREGWGTRLTTED